MPTSVTIHSLLKNGVKRGGDEAIINVAILIKQLDWNEKVLFRNIFDKIVNILHWNKEGVGLYFVDIPRDKENEF